MSDFTLSERFVIRNKDGTPPMDVWGRPIVSGATVLGTAGLRFVVRVGTVQLATNHAGFYFISSDHDGRTIELQAGAQAGAHVDWEVVGLPGRPAPKSKEEIRRDSEGRPLIGPVNGGPRQQPPCPIHGFDPASP